MQHFCKCGFLKNNFWGYILHSLDHDSMIILSFII
jgi:hypothetical protein